MTTFNDLKAELDGVFYRPLVIITIGGAGSHMDGYPADMAEALIAAGFPGEHQPVGGPYDAAAFPMGPSVQRGQIETLRLFRQVWAGYDIVVIAYSEGSLVWKATWDAMSADERTRVKAVVTIGFPARQEGHTIPNGIDPGGHGIVTPNMVDTPDMWWDLAAGKHMVGSPGQDLYTTLGYDGNATSVADEEAVWKIVDEGTLTSAEPLGLALVGLLTNPTVGLVAAAYAVVDAGLFFVAEGLTPHTSYQTVQPIAGDPRDCWRVGYDYLWSVGQQYAPGFVA